MITKLYIENYKIIQKACLNLKPKLNIFVGDNDSGKSTVLEALSIITSGKLNGYPLERQLRPSLFNINTREHYLNDITNGRFSVPPRIIMEAYFDETTDPVYKGTNNSLNENSSGIRLAIEFDSAYSDVYQKLFSDKSIKEIPIEFYKVTFHYFSCEDEKVYFRTCPVKSVLIDASHKDYSYMVSKFIHNSIDDVLNDDEQIELSQEYSKTRTTFRNSESVKRLNQELQNRNTSSGKTIEINFQEESIDAWKDQMTIEIDKIPFDNIGFGTQNTLKSELAFKNVNNRVNIILMEEPENNLSYTNMSKLIDNISEVKDKQVFIATHSSFVANKLDINNIFLFKEGNIVSFDSFGDETVDFFKKLPGYDTLRVVLAEKAILVEGPTDELIVERAYKDNHSHLPIKDGIDVIVAGGLTFKRYCDIAIKMKKTIYIVTDNDSSTEKVNDRYKDYIENEYIKIFYEKDSNLNTIEPSVLSVNSHDGIPNLAFQHIVCKSQESQMNFDNLVNFMKNNKTLWALRVFDAEECIKYPEYINDAIK